MQYGKAQHPVVVKRYAGSRLYHPDRGVYLTREDLISMALRGEPFCVVDASTREDVTSSFRPIIVENANT